MKRIDVVFMRVFCIFIFKPQFLDRDSHFLVVNYEVRDGSPWVVDTVRRSRWIGRGHLASTAGT